MGKSLLKLCSPQTVSLGLSILCYPEILSSLNRRLREGSITSEDYRFAKNRLVDRSLGSNAGKP
jgi:hypothetical protein